MAKMGSFNAKGLKEFQKKLNKISDKRMDKFVDSCAKELAARLLSKVIKRTPVGEYNEPVNFTTKDGTKVSFKPKKGKVGGTLRRGWTSETHEEAEQKTTERVPDDNAAAYVKSLKIEREGNIISIEIKNPVEYASYVEHGHRKVNDKGWVPGHHMLKISEREIQEIAPKVLESKINRFLKGCFK